MAELDIFGNAIEGYWNEWKNAPLYELPVAQITVPIRAGVKTLFDWFYEPPAPAAPPQTTARPAAPRTTAELTSGMWTPEDAYTIGQREAVQEIIRQNSGGSPPPPPGPKDTNNTILWVLAAVAATGTLIAITRK